MLDKLLIPIKTSSRNKIKLQSLSQEVGTQRRKTESINKQMRENIKTPFYKQLVYPKIKFNLQLTNKINSDLKETRNMYQEESSNSIKENKKLKLPNAFDRNTVIRGSVEVFRNKSIESRTLEWMSNNREAKSSVDNPNKPLSNIRIINESALLSSKMQPLVSELMPNMKTDQFLNITFDNQALMQAYKDLELKV